jgi:putative phosphonate catabolism associated alcohol dehydrogenase
MNVIEIDSILYERWCRAAVFHGPGLAWEMAPIDLHSGGDEAVVSVEACTLCSSDVHTVMGRRSGPVPSVLGHEAIGKVISLPESWTLVDVAGNPVAVDSRIVWGVAAHCGECLFCRDGIPQKCKKLVKYGHGHFRPGTLPKGGLAGFVGLVPGTPVVVLDDSMDARVACLAACAGATVAGALRLAGHIQGRHIAVFGGGVLGCIACAMADEMGAASVTCVEPDPVRRDRALAFGASQSLDPAEPDFETRLKSANDGLGMDVCLEITGANSAFEAAMKSLRTGGTMVLVGAVYPAGPVAILQEDIVRRMLTIKGLHNYAPVDLKAAVDFLQAISKKEPALWAELFGPEFALEDIAGAFAWAADNPGVRGVVRP